MAMASSEKAAPTAGIFAPLVRLVRRSWLFVLFFIGFFVAWEGSVLVFHIPPYILPKPSDIVVSGWVDIDKLVYYTWITGSESVLGYLVAVTIAVPLGLAIAFSSFLRQTIYPFFVSLEMTPKIAFAPLFISWLGFGLLPKVIIVFLVCLSKPGRR
jgi:NitT/TauT family transport system permease protein